MVIHPEMFLISEKEIIFNYKEVNSNEPNSKIFCDTFEVVKAGA